MQSGIAAQQSVESDEGLKVAAKLYQVTTCLDFTATQLGGDFHVKASFTQVVNVSIYVSRYRHFDGQNRCATHFAHQSVHHH